MEPIHPREAFENAFGQYYRNVAGEFCPSPQIFGWLTVDLILPVLDPNKFATQYSNSSTIGHEVRDLASQMGEAFSDCFENLYIGVIPSALTTSEAVSRRNLIGDLVTIECGLRDAVGLWAVAFNEYMANYSQKYDDRKNNNHDMFVDQFLAVFRNVRARDGDLRKDAVEAFLTATGLYHEHTFVDDDKKDFAYFVSPNSDGFIVTHELSHHLMNHTGSKEGSHNFLAEAIESVPPPRLVWQSNLPAHDREFLADHVAIDLIMGGGVYSVAPLRNEKIFGTIAGALATLSTLSCLSPNPYADTASHPASARRFDNLHALFCAKNTQFGVCCATGDSEPDDIALFRDVKRMLQDILDFNDTLNGRRKELGEVPSS